MKRKRQRKKTKEGTLSDIVENEIKFNGLRQGFSKALNKFSKNLKYKNSIQHSDLTNIPFVTIDGEDSKDFLQGLITNDINKCNSKNTIYSCILTPQGKFIADFFIIEFENNFLIEIDKKFNDDFLNREMLASERFNRDGIDRSRFSMDSYYPLLCGYGNKLDVTRLLKDFYIEELGIKCVIEEPWVTLDESSQSVIALIKSGDVEAAHKIFSDIMKLKNKDGIFPTGYQYKLDIFWPEENSTWTNAAVIMAADCLFDLTGK